MTEEEQINRYLKNARLFLRKRLENNEIKGITIFDINTMDIVIADSRPYLSEKVVNVLSEEIKNDLEIIWSSGQIPSDLLS